MNKPALNEGHQLRLAREYCSKHEMRYLSHKYYYHSNGNYNQLWIAVEDYSGRYEIKLDLNTGKTSF